MSDPSTLRRAIPVLASLHIARTVAFYVERLGFRARFTYGEYGGVERDAIEIHFWLCDDAEIPKMTSCRVEVTGIDTLYAEMKAAGVVHPNGPLTTQPWGFREFSIVDGEGNCLKFAERVGPA